MLTLVVKLQVEQVRGLPWWLSYRWNRLEAYLGGEVTGGAG